jgi:hypothetical protein
MLLGLLLLNAAPVSSIALAAIGGNQGASSEMSLATQALNKVLQLHQWIQPSYCIL